MADEETPDEEKSKRRIPTGWEALGGCVVLVCMCGGLPLGCAGLAYVVAWALAAGWRAGWGV